MALNMDKLAHETHRTLLESMTDRELARGTLYEALQYDSVTEIFDRYLRQNGIIGYTEQIMQALDSIRVAHK